MRAHMEVDSAMQVRFLQDLFRGGFESHHTLRGTCGFRIAHDPRLDFSVHLDVGRVEITPGIADGADAVVTMQAAALEAIALAQGSIDFRDAVLTDTVKVEGSTEFYLLVAHGWMRPPPEEVAVLVRAEERSRKLEQTRPIREVERLSAPPEAEVLERIQAGIPFIATGLPTSRLGDMTLAEFRAAYGHLEISLAGDGKPVTIEHLFSRIDNRKDGELYTRGSFLPQELAPLFPPPYFPSRVHLPQIWLGAGKNAHVPVTPIHRDLGAGFLRQIYGSKRITLFAPHEAPCVYPKSAFFNYQLCWVEPHQPDLKRFPRFAEAHPIEVVLSPGELLVQPAGWFHQVYSLDEVTLSVSNFIFE